MNQKTDILRKISRILSISNKTGKSVAQHAMEEIEEETGYKARVRNCKKKRVSYSDQSLTYFRSENWASRSFPVFSRPFSSS